MAVEKWRQDLIAEALAATAALDEAQAIYVKVPASAVYKKTRKQDEDQPNLYVGKRFAAKMTSGKDLKGYGLAVILDYSTDEGYWRDGTTAICQITAASNEQTREWVGRLIAVRLNMMSSWYYGGHWTFAGWDWKNYPWEDSQ